ncbi:C2 domain-containing protein At1g53590-like isoform X2 [Andrographis paniculata]|nr:C2 domain-containing protein At1g53590-like isoform X2 [Andrographis paniculata]XP_051126237.1 C2 domain-containing protein At1g53590-like isoform X2 [Andrographis paniculata]
MITEIRVLQNSSSDDHLVLEIGMNFRTADDMSAILGVKLRKRLGFGMWAKLHLLGMHIEGKVLVGVKFLREWPFIGRLRVCFAAPPYFQMTVKPMFSHGLDVTEVPGISGWIDNLLALVFEQTLVEPNMLVVDVEKFVSPQPENWFSIDAKEAVANVIVEVIEGAEMKPSDLNGLADPYVKGQLGPFRFETKIQKKTLAPKWLEEFKIPICSWDALNILVLDVRDKDHVFDDMMGKCCVSINELKDGRRHDMWLPLQNIKMGRLHVAVTVSEANGKATEPLSSARGSNANHKRVSFEADPTPTYSEAESKKESDYLSQKASSPRMPEQSPEVEDKFEPVNIEGQEDTGIWIQHPGSDVGQVWEPREGKSRSRDSSHNLSPHVKGDIGEDDDSSSSSSDENAESLKQKSKKQMRRGLKKIGSMFHKDKGPGVEDKTSPSEQFPQDTIRETELPKDYDFDKNVSENPHGNVKHRAKNMLKQAGKSARELKSVLSRKRTKKHNAQSRSFPTGRYTRPGPNASDDDDDNSSSCTDTELAEAALPGSGAATAVVAPASVPVLHNNDSLKLKDDVIGKAEVVVSGNSSGKENVLGEIAQAAEAAMVASEYDDAIAKSGNL